ncbi:MAG: aldo/keto reductase [Spirochaetia bacterium]
MKETQLSTTDIHTSRVGLGTWAIGGWMWGGTDEDLSIETIRRALIEGVGLIDTAPIYGFGESERIVGQALKGLERSSFELATKVGIEWHEGNPYRNASRDRILKEIEDSLTRLDTDYIDVYQVHWPDPNVTIEETAATMRELYEQQLIRAIGVSNFSVEQMRQFMDHAPLHTCQPPYNLFERGIEGELKPFCKQNGIALITYGALCRGLLTGKMIGDTSFEGDDLRKIDPKFQEPRYSQYLKAVERLKQVAEKYHKSLVQLSVNWILQQGVEVALWGARKPEQLADIDGTMDWDILDEDMRQIDQILQEEIDNPIGPDFMAPPARET